MAIKLRISAPKYSPEHTWSLQQVQTDGTSKFWDFGADGEYALERAALLSPLLGTEYDKVEYLLHGFESKEDEDFFKEAWNIRAPKYRLSTPDEY